MKIAVVGSTGLLGRALTKHFCATGIHRGNYDEHIGCSYDLLINANGNSKKFWAQIHQMGDFELSVRSVYRTVFDFPAKKYVYISSVDAGQGPNETVYGFHKRLAEQIVTYYHTDFFILRCTALIGKRLRKGIVFDIENNNPLFVHKESRIQFIHVDDIGRIIERLIERKKPSCILNAGGTGTTPIPFIENLFNTHPATKPQAVCQRYAVDVSPLKSIFPELKTSNDYVRMYHHERMEQSI